MNHLFDRFGAFTMCDEPTFKANIALAETVRTVPGAIVECGVWRGGMMAAIAASLGQYRRFVLFDSFQGLPIAREIDGQAAMRWQADVTSPAWRANCAAPRDDAERSMRMSGAENFEIVEGWFAETLRSHAWREPIALLRLDADWYEATKLCLEQLFDRVAPGGLIIVDDYYVWDGCAKALHEFLAERRSAVRIRQYEGLVAFMVKD